MSRKKIYDNDPLYTVLRLWSDWGIRYSYRKIEVHGEEKLPKDGALLLTPNHCNTLMDALVMLRANKGSTVFGARADLFNSQFIAKLMFFLRILPMVRQRDGLRNVLKNKDTQETIVETLENGVRFCMYPEGTHRTKHSLRALGKGAFRAAIAANEKFGKDKPVYIIPTGIEYGDYFRYHSSSLVNYGEAINVTEFVKHADPEVNEAQLINALSKELAQRMSQQFTFIKDDENYDAKWALTKILAIVDRKKGYGEHGTNLYNDMERNRSIVEKIEKACEEHPEEMAGLLDDVMDFEKERNRRKVSIYAFKKMKSPVAHAIGKGFAALVGLPYFLFSAIASLPMWAAGEIVRGKIRDKAFGNTVCFGMKLGIGPLLFIIYAALAFCFAPWWLATALLALFLPSYGYFYDYIEGFRRFMSEIRLLGNKKLWKKFKHINKDFKKLTSNN